MKDEDFSTLKQFVVKKYTERYGEASDVPVLPDNYR